MLNFTIQFYLLLKPKKLSELPSFKSKFFQTQTPREQGGEEATKARELREYLNGILNNAGIPSIQQEQREYENPIGPTEMPDKFIITTKENFFFKKYLGFKYLGYYRVQLRSRHINISLVNEWDNEILKLYKAIQSKFLIGNGLRCYNMQIYIEPSQGWKNLQDYKRIGRAVVLWGDQVIKWMPEVQYKKYIKDINKLGNKKQLQGTLDTIMTYDKAGILSLFNIGSGFIYSSMSSNRAFHFVEDAGKCWFCIDCLPTSEDPNGMNHWIAYALGFVYYAISTKDEKRTILPTPKETEKIIREGAKALNIKPDSLENFHKMRMPTEFEPRINDQLGQLQRIHDDGRRDYLTLPHSGPDHGRRKRRATMFAKGTVNFAIKMFAPRPFITVRDNM